jgi:thiamine pyrophosphate-dependent acetolactate synthase large subunit-like protein
MVVIWCDDGFVQCAPGLATAVQQNCLWQAGFLGDRGYGLLSRCQYQYYADRPIYADLQVPQIPSLPERLGAVALHVEDPSQVGHVLSGPAIAAGGRS